MNQIKQGEQIQFMDTVSLIVPSTKLSTINSTFPLINIQIQKIIIIVNHYIHHKQFFFFFFRFAKVTPEAGTKVKQNFLENLALL